MWVSEFRECSGQQGKLPQTEQMTPHLNGLPTPERVYSSQTVDVPLANSGSTALIPRNREVTESSTVGRHSEGGLRVITKNLQMKLQVPWMVGWPHFGEGKGARMNLQTKMYRKRDLLYFLESH